MRKLTHAAESEERLEAYRRGTMRIDKRIAYKEAVFMVLEHYFLLQQHSSHTIECCGNFITIKLTNVLVALRTVVVSLILVKSKVEFRAVLYHRYIH